jgi:hypothetical protein
VIVIVSVTIGVSHAVIELRLIFASVHIVPKRTRRVEIVDLICIDGRVDKNAIEGDTHCLKH